MKVARTVLVLGFAAIAVAMAVPTAQAGVGTFGPVSVTPSPVIAPAQAEVRFSITGLAAEASTEFSINPTLVPKGEFSGGFAATARVDEAMSAVRLEGPGTLVPLSMSIASLAPSCLRGGTYSAGRTTYRLTVPAGATSTIVARVFVPKGFSGTDSAVLVNASPLAGEGVIRPAVDPAPFTIPRKGNVDAVSLKASKVKNGEVRFSGRIKLARRGVAVSLVSRAATSDMEALSVLGLPESALIPLTGLATVGTTKTGKGGKFSLTAKAPKGVAVVARTAGAKAGVSCPVLVSGGD